MMHQVVGRKRSADDWCILRTSAGQTLALAKSLAESDIDAWTPLKVARRRLPRGRKSHREIEAPIMPTFVFVRYDRLDDLRAILALPMTPHPAFSIFRHLGAIPSVLNREIERLRTQELRGQPKAKRPVFNAGARVRVEEDNFTGLHGVVEGSEGGFTFVCFGGAIQFKIATMHLRTDEVHERLAPVPRA